MIGAVLRLETPEGIDLVVSPAGPVPRGLAMAIDALITQTTSLLVGMALVLLGDAGVGIYLVLLFGIEWFYPVLFEVLRGGQTPGKSLLGLRVVHADATPIGWNASLLRNLLRTADFFPFFYVGGLVCMLLTDRFQRMGDLAANTLVVHVDTGGARSTSTSLEAEGLGARAAPVALSPVEQRALLGFAERQEELSRERAIELAEVLAPLTGASGEAARQEVLRIANGLSGRV